MADGSLRINRKFSESWVQRRLTSGVGEQFLFSLTETDSSRRNRWPKINPLLSLPNWSNTFANDRRNSSGIVGSNFKFGQICLPNSTERSIRSYSYSRIYHFSPLSSDPQSRVSIQILEQIRSIVTLFATTTFIRFAYQRTNKLWRVERSNGILDVKVRLRFEHLSKYFLLWKTEEQRPANSHGLIKSFCEKLQISRLR